MSKGEERIVLTRNAFMIYLSAALLIGVHLPAVFVMLVGAFG